MAINQLISFLNTTLLGLRWSTGRKSVKDSPSNGLLSLPCQVRSMDASIPTGQTIVRRSEITFHKHNWDYDFIQSLTSKYVAEPYTARANKLTAKVRIMLDKEMETIHQLEKIDNLERLGLAYHFESEIDTILQSIIDDHNPTNTPNDLYATALQFRLLRQHGHNVPQEVFSPFLDEDGNFKQNLGSDMKGMLYLYEASYVSVGDEDILEDARVFSTGNLEKYAMQHCNCTDDYLSKLVSHALESPLAWRMLRLEAMWFINAYESKNDMEPILVELAKLDFNRIQAIYQEDLKYSFRWWKKTGIAEKLDFARDWLMENFFVAVAMIDEPQFGYGRRMQTKINQLLTTMDDIYDVYGTVEELELLTDVIVRWDINAMDQLPDYMKLFFLALQKYINEMAYDILKDQGFHVIPYLKKTLADLSKSYLWEAKCYYSGYTPTLQEYLEKAWITIAAPVMLVNAYFCVTNPITQEASQCLEEYPDMIRWSSMILRLVDDLGTSIGEMRRGDVSKSIQCYMHDTGVSDEEARDHIKVLIRELWKKINRDRFANPLFSQNYTRIVENFARMAHCTYGHGDNYDIALQKAKDNGTSLFIQPIEFH